MTDPPQAPRRRRRSPRLAALLASAGFLVLIVGITYFALLVFNARFGEEPSRAAALRELGQFLTGKLSWYQDARVYGAVSILLALLSILAGSHSLARITLVVAGGTNLLLLFAEDQIYDTILFWIHRGG